MSGIWESFSISESSSHMVDSVKCCLFFSVSSSMQVLISNISSISGKTHSFILRFCWIFSGILILLFCAVVLGDVFHLSLSKTVGIWWSSDGNFVSRFPLLMSVFHMTPLSCWGPSATLLETLKFSAFYCLAISYPLSVANYGGRLSTFYFFENVFILSVYVYIHVPWHVFRGQGTALWNGSSPTLTWFQESETDHQAWWQMLLSCLSCWTPTLDSLIRI